MVEKDGVLGSKAALALGAEIVERHFTILPRDQTKDGPVSINKSQLQQIAEFMARPIHSRVEELDESSPGWRHMMGDKNRRLSNVELLNRDYYRGRFASGREETKNGIPMIYNWEEVLLT